VEKYRNFNCPGKCVTGVGLR